jgi:hypothetical protein
MTTSTMTHPLADCLLADAPDPACAESLALFGQFVGRWDLEVTNHVAEGGPATIPGEWHFGWALGGRAVADVWIAPSRAHRRATGDPRGEHGTTIRFPDPALGAWRSTWLGPVDLEVLAFLGRAVGEEIHLTGSFEDGVDTRWAFSDITPSSFAWRAEESHDGGASWRLLRTFRATRVS